MKALILYQSLFGNTSIVAKNLAKGIHFQGIESDCTEINEIKLENIQDYDFIAIGGPTHDLGISKEMNNFLSKLQSLKLVGKYGFSFDTRLASFMNKKIWFTFENSAAKRIEAKMKSMKMKIVKSHESAVVQSKKGPLKEHTAENFFALGQEIGQILQTS